MTNIERKLQAEGLRKLETEARKSGFRGLRAQMEFEQLGLRTSHAIIAAQPGWSHVVLASHINDDGEFTGEHSLSCTPIIAWVIDRIEDHESGDPDLRHDFHHVTPLTPRGNELGRDFAIKT